MILRSFISLDIFETLLYEDWYQRMGDPTVAGWTITIAYFLVTLLCWRAGLKEKTINVNIQKPERHVLWFGLSMLLLFLGINKQLDGIENPIFGRKWTQTRLP